MLKQQVGSQATDLGLQPAGSGCAIANMSTPVLHFAISNCIHAHAAAVALQTIVNAHIHASMPPTRQVHGISCTSIG